MIFDLFGMLLLFKVKRRKAMKENKFSTYLLIGAGEIILVVVGILIAIQIDDWTRDLEQVREEREIYQLIIADLKKDSILLGRYYSGYTSYLDTYFALNEAAKGSGQFTGFLPDYIVSNVEFNTVTKNNHEISIDQLRDGQAREAINSYFQGVNICIQAKDEFNKLVELKTRPYFLNEHEVFNNSIVFNHEDRTFPPFLGVSTIDTTKLATVIKEPAAIALISQLRMSIGFYLSSIERSINRNAELISTLESKLK